MLKRISGVLVFVGLFTLSVLLVNCGGSSSRPSGLLYVLSEAESNVSSFAVDLNSGNLSLINSNATTCTQAPCGLPLQVSLDPTGATAFVLNQGYFDNGQGHTPPIAPSGIVPSIYGYTVNSDGSFGGASDITSNPSPPVSSACNAGTQGVFNACDIALAMTRDAAGKFLFVVTGGNQALPGLPPQFALPALPPMLYVFTTQPGSTTLTLASSLTLTKIPTALSVIAFTNQAGTAETLVFVTNTLDLNPNEPPNDNTLSVYAMDSSGNLTEQLNSPYSTQSNPTVVQAVNTNPQNQTTGGIFVYVGSQGAGAGAISGFQVCTSTNGGGPNSCTQTEVDDNVLLPLGTPTTGGQNPVAMLVDPTNSFLYVLFNGSNQVYAYGMGTGTGKLTTLSPASMPTGSQPMALAMHASSNTNSEFLYVSNNLSSSITGFTIEATTGSMSNPITVQFVPGEPSGMAGK